MAKKSFGQKMGMLGLYLLLVGAMAVVFYQMELDLYGGYTGTVFSFILITGLITFFLLLFLLLHIIIHEIGHLITGLISGYRFSLFRIFQWTVVNDNGKLRFTKLSIAGTGGQCLMLPPENNDNPPYRLYLSGGALANVVAAIPALLFYISRPSSLWLIFAIAGFISAVINIYPAGFNDGMTIRKLTKSVTARRQLMQQLDYSDQFITGLTFKEVNPEEFIHNPKEPITEQFNTYATLIEVYHYLDRDMYSEALFCLQPLWENKEDIIGPYQTEVIREYIFCNMILGNVDERLIDEALDNKVFQNYLKATNTEANRMKAALAWFKDNDRKEAVKWIEKARHALKHSTNLADKEVNSRLIDQLEKEIG